ncbi:hypothetical protein AK95_25820 [Paenibacillus sp. LC231]|uniref:hypothetical protein n=1 Tax=Paenibacillus sp. LC231 TaxID=1120679 RepID=UPI0008DD56D5|nr:hypothetical protein [Paenibacillus sp. LC231]OIB00595.1 hypothetical protein AK95_25820 [Paenibacillus sp. LC231]
MQFGPFVIRIDWLIIAVSGFAGFIAMQWLCKRYGNRAQSILDPVANALLWILIIWKFSPLVSTPSLLSNHPFLWLTMPGTMMGWWIGLIVGSIYLYRAWYRLQVSWWLIGDLFTFGGGVTYVTYSMLAWQYGSLTTLPWGISIHNPEFHYHPINIYRLIILLPMLVWIWKNAGHIGSGKWLTTALKFPVMGLMIVSLFDSKPKWLIPLSFEQMVYLILMLLGIGLSLRNARRDQTNISNERIIEEGQNEASGILQSHSRNLDIDPIRPKDSRKEKGSFLSD